MMAVPLPIEPGRWLLRCPVDDALIAPGVAVCPDCGLSTAPLRALALAAASHLETARAVGPELAVTQVGSASALVPESENFLLDAGRALSGAGAYEAALEKLAKAVEIAPGRKDVKAELVDVQGRVRPTAWLAAGLPRVEAAIPVADRQPQAHAAPLAPTAPRTRLMVSHVVAREERGKAEPGSAAYRVACLEVARIEVEIAGLSRDETAAA